MPNAQEILKAGLLSDTETPEETLNKLFELKGWDGKTGKAFVGVCYGEEGNPNGVYGAQTVGKDALSKWRHEVSRTHTGFLHVTLLDFVAKSPCHQHPRPRLV
jgi:hypothetical protein